MTEQLQLRRGVAAQVAAFTGAAGEVVVDTTNNRLVVQDGATAGGFAAAKLVETQFQTAEIGVATAPDPANPLSVYGAAALFNGANFNFTLNKSVAGNTASVIFEDGFSGRAQIGLCGDDNLHFKVSPDGSAWLDALDINAATGQVSFNHGIAAGNATGFRNRIINGAMDIWQRGTSFSNPTAATTYCADRWSCLRAGYAAGLSALRVTGVPINGANRNALRIQRSAGDTSTATIFLTQSLESANSRDLAGQPVTLSAWLRVGANFSAAGLQAAIYSGTGTDEGYRSGIAGSTTPATVTAPSSQTAYAQISVSGVLPSNANEMGVVFNYAPSGTAGANDWFEVLDVQLEAGPVATPFERRPIGQELALCQWYFQSYNKTEQLPYAAFGFIVVNSSTAAFNYFMFPKMRAAPTVSYAAYSSFIIGALGLPISSIANDIVTAYSLSTSLGISGGTGGQAGRLQSGSAGLGSITLSAEL